MTDLFLSVVIPAYNEGLRIGTSLESVVSYLRSRQFRFEVLVIDDGSRDQTFDIAQHFTRDINLQFQVRVFRNERNRGKGYSVRRGMLEARGQYALMTDADLSSPIEELPRLEREACHLAFGSRDVAGSQVEVHQPWPRETSGKIFNRFVRLLTALPYRDTQCGFKLFDMRRCRALFERQTIENFAFDVELLYMARKWGLSLREVPVVWRHAPGSRVRFMRDAPPMLTSLFTIRWNDLRGKYTQPRSAVP